MCVVSMIMDHYGDKWRRNIQPEPVIVPQPYPVPMPYPVPVPPLITPAEVDEFRKLLERAREYDRKNNEPDCELEEKKRVVRELAEKMGVKIDFL